MSSQAELAQQDLHKYTVPELIAFCKHFKVKGYSGRRKDDLIKLLRDLNANANKVEKLAGQASHSANLAEDAATQARLAAMLATEQADRAAEHARSARQSANTAQDAIKLTRPELLVLCKVYGLKGVSNMNKNDLVTRLKTSGWHP
jgi:hypothetical protein